MNRAFVVIFVVVKRKGEFDDYEKKRRLTYIMIIMVG